MTGKLSYPLNQKVYEDALKGASSTKKTRTSWNRSEISYLKKNAKSKTYEEMAAALGKTKDSIASMLYKMRKNKEKFTNLKLWSKEDDKFLAMNYGTMKREEIAKKLGRTAVAVQIRFSVLNRTGKLVELTEPKQLKINFNKKASKKAAQPEVKEIKVEEASKVPVVKEVPVLKNKKESDKGQAFMIGLTILNTIILSWILFSSFIH